MLVGLARARWAPLRDGPEGGGERLAALGHLAVALHDSGDLAGARVLYDERLAVLRRTRGDEHTSTLQASHGQPVAPANGYGRARRGAAAASRRCQAAGRCSEQSIRSR